MNLKPTQPYTPQTLSWRADIKIRARLFSLFLKRTLSKSGARFAVVGFVVATLVLTIVPGQLETYRVNAFIAQAEATHLTRENRMKSEVFFHTFVVREGEDKAAYVAKAKNIPLADAQSVPLRHDTVQEWRYGITNLSYIETDVRGRPVEVKLNLENDDHMHIFEYAPQSCGAQERAGIESESCTKSAEASPTYRAHRSTFDSVHDIESVYAEEIAYQQNPNALIDFSELSYVGEEEEWNVKYRVFATRDDALEMQYFFDAQTHELKKRVITLIEGDQRYEMSEIEEVEYAFLPPSEAPEVFSPKRFSFEQLEVIPLTPQS